MPPRLDVNHIHQAPKVPYPRQLTKKETLDSLSHWQTSVRNYFRRFDYYANFFKRTSTWTQNANYGFTGEGSEEKADNLESLLDTIASFLPGPFITHQITKTSTSIQSIWDIIWDHYGVKPSPSSFMDYDLIKYDKEERYIDLYDKMIYHAINHLCPSGTQGSSTSGGTLAQNDRLTLSHRNLIAMDWLRRINPSLVSIVKLEYSKDLKAGLPLESLVRDISENIDAMLHRSNSPQTRMVSASASPIPPQEEIITEIFQHPPPSEQDPNVLRVSSFPYRPRPPTANYRGFQSRPNFSGGFQPRQNFSGRNFRQQNPRQNGPPQNKPFCQACFTLGKKLNIIVDWSHSPSSCPQNSAVRCLQDYEDQPTTSHHEGEECIPPPPMDPQIKSNDFQTMNLDQQIPSTRPNLISSSTWMDSINVQVRKLESLLSSPVRKAQSPSLNMSLNNISVFPTIDEGSEINVIDSSFANNCNITFSRTAHQATAAGSQQMSVVGETKDDVILHKTIGKQFIRWNLKKCIVVNNLGCPLLIGEPGKQDNFISTIPSKKIICTYDVNNSPVSIPYQSKPRLYNRNFICRLSGDLVVNPGEKVDILVPTMLMKESSLVFTPRVTSAPSLPLPSQTCAVQGNHVSVLNSSNSLVILKKNEHFGDLVPIVEASQVQKSKNDSLSTLKVQIKPTNYLTDVSIDPDNILSQEWKDNFKNILQDFSDIITPIPGSYNNFYGEVDCSLNFIQDPPSSNKARLPSYSHDKLVSMAEQMDLMESWGVLKKPHDLGITVRNVHTSYLVPKTDGSYRFVTDFTSLLPFIGKVEVLTTTIPQAKRILSSFKHFVELDLSHCFWQGCMSAEDSAYLATPHPFGGLRVYAREPQGIRNASEHNSERLSVIFGDLEQQKKMTRMADGLYIGGETLEELSENLIEVLSRAKNCGLTFKPSKVVICPQSTILFGWKKNGDKWSPTNHVVSPLAVSPPPKTVKQLRGWIGAYRQVSDTIKDHSITLSTLEKETAGRKSRDEIKWSQPLLKDFQEAKDSLKKSQSITIPIPTDILHIYPDFSQTANAVGGHLIIERKQGQKIAKLNGGYFSVRLNDSQSRWTPCEKETLGIKLNIEHFKPFIRESYNTTIIHPDNMISVHAWNRLKKGIISSSSKVAAFLSSLSENNIDLIHCPGINTKVADFASRHPISCNEPRCQICKYMSEQCEIGEHCLVNSISVEDILSGTSRLPLTEKPAWIEVQKNDDMHRRLFKLITSGGLQPERKLRGHTELKLMYNLYKKGLLKIDSFGLIVVKHIDTSSGTEYEAISVPKSMYPSVIQSLHIKLQHPSRNQMHKFVHRYFHCTGSTVSIDQIHKSCQVCTSLTNVPPPILSFSTEPVETVGSNFSADVLVSDNQKVFICREKLTQFTYSRIIEDETADTFRTVILDAVLDLMPSSGATVQVDAATGLKSIEKSLQTLENDDILAKYSIKLEIGRVHNKNKNPIAENAIKEFRKERLRLNPRGGIISDQERIIITKNMNSRIRNRGFSAKEMLFKRENMTNSSISVDDKEISKAQFDLRTKVNDKHNISVTKPLHNFSIGERVFIIDDLSKLRSREEHIIVSLFTENNEGWAVIQKSERQFRQKSYNVKLSELMPVSSNFSLPNKVQVDDDENNEAFTGFSSQQYPTEPTSLQKAISNLKETIPSSRGRPKPMYPDYIHDPLPILSQTEPFHGFPTQTNRVKESEQVSKNVLLHGWIQSDTDDEDNDYFFYDCLPPTRNIRLISEHNPTDSDSEYSDNSVPNYISSDDDIVLEPSVDEDLWWEAQENPEGEHQVLPSNLTITMFPISQEVPSNPGDPQQSSRFKSETDSHFLMRADIVSTDSSSLSDDDQDLDETICNSVPQSPVPQESRVFDFTDALQQLHQPLTNDVVNLENLAQPTVLPRLRDRSGQRANYRSLHLRGKSE